jgi:hypothetical protein
MEIYSGNPHYFSYLGKPVVLLTSDQHYGAVINRDFDYEAFLDKLGSHGLNFTRIYPGAYIEREDEYVKGNNLGPPNGHQILPWTRTKTTGAHEVLGGYKYDLDRWDEEYFRRLGDFCDKARERNIIVEACLFNGMYKDRWAFQAMYYTNNIQEVGKCEWDMVQSLDGDPRLVSYQEKYVREITRRLNDFENVIFHACDEPWISRKPPELFGPWVSRIIDTIRDAEHGLPKKHLLGQTVDFDMSKNASDFSADPRIDYIDVEYAKGIDDLQMEYEHQKPIAYIESVFFPTQYSEDKIASTRVEAWEFMIGGAAGFMQLNDLYSSSNGGARGTEIDSVLQVFVDLRKFLESFPDQFAMKRDDSFLVKGVPQDAYASAMNEPGRQYAFYIHHSTSRTPYPYGTARRRTDGHGPPREYCYVASKGKYSEKLVFRFPAGRYDLEWVDPATAVVIGRESLIHAGGDREVQTPAYTTDLALRMLAAS